MKIYNFSRKDARNLDIKFDGLWIQISEPGKPETLMNDNITGKKLNFSFWDIESPATDVLTKEILPVISAHTCLAIVSSLMLHARDDKRNVLVNCRAGKSRSTAICKFAEDKLGFTWERRNPDEIKPNKFVYDSLVAAYEDLKAVIAAFNEAPPKKRKKYERRNKNNSDGSSPILPNEG